MARKRPKMTVTVDAAIYEWICKEVNSRELTLTAVVEEALTLYATGCLFQADTGMLSRVKREKA